jgi:hypothetical protein
MKIVVTGFAFCRFEGLEAAERGLIWEAQLLSAIFFNKEIMNDLENQLKVWKKLRKRLTENVNKRKLEEMI